jgi:hypothetical protein
LHPNFELVAAAGADGREIAGNGRKSEKRMKSAVVEGFCVGVEKGPWRAGDAASWCKPALGGGEWAVPNAGPQHGLPAVAASGVAIKIKWSPEVAWCKSVELSRR